MKYILIVDDDENILDLIELSLLREGVEIDKARDGEEALKKSKEKHYDIILLDLMMPKMDGRSACQEIRKMFDIPILILSAKNEKNKYLLNSQLRVNEYINKPFDPEQLSKTVSRYLN